jgi:hypothetical protein
VITGTVAGTRTRRVRLTAGALLAAEAVAVAVLLGRSTPMLVPVVTTAGSRVFTVTSVNVGIGATVPLVLGAVLLLTGITRNRRLRWLESSLSASITVFLLAELNGIRELAALVAMYALTSAAIMFAALQDGLRDRRRPDRPRTLAASFGAMVGIVPWGLIAWYEIVPGVVGDTGPATWVRVLTVVVLALFSAGAVMVWRGAGNSLSAVVISVVTRSVFAWGVAAAVHAGPSLTSIS